MIEQSDPDETDSPILHRTYEKKPPRTFRSWLIGRPLPTADAPHQTIGKAMGLAVFAGDALSSVAYAPQETLVILAAAGAAGMSYAFPIAVVVTILLAIVTISYQQTIHAYPGGGGAYIVARDNLGELAAQTAGAALLTDYILLAAVAVSSGTAQIVSAFPALLPYRVPLAVFLVLAIMLANLRGVRESGTLFAIPTYFFLATTFLMVIVGFIRYLNGSLGVVVDPPPIEFLHGAQAVTVFLILRAFANGTTALTGVECISNGVTAFKEPRSHNAGLTMIWMSTILGVLFLGITFLLGQIGAVPSEEETVISQLARTVYGGRGILYLCTIAGTTIILVLATNTAFADFPRLAALQAADGFLPRQLTYRGSRLVFSRGIIALGVIASLLVILFRASVTALVPLWAIGVFVIVYAFADRDGAALVEDWTPAARMWKCASEDRPCATRPGWQLRMVVNGFGAVCTAVVTVVFAATKFRDGAWIVVVTTPLMVATFFAIHHHYRNLAQSLSLKRDQKRIGIKRHRVILPISGVHEGTLAALSYARALSDDVTAVYVSIDPVEAESIRSKWEVWGEGVRLVILDSPYRLLLEPLLDYIGEISAKRQPREMITIVVPQFVPRVWWHNLLHTQTATWLRFALLFKRGIVITDVPYQVE